MTGAAALPTTPRAWHARIWSLSWPVVLANVTIPLVGLVDTAVMGRMPDPAFIGAVAVGATIFSALYWIFGFLRMGTTGLTAQALGAGRREEIAAVAFRAALLALLIGLTALALQHPLGTLALWLFEASPMVEDLARRYFDIRIWGAPALMLHLVQLGVLFGLQRMRQTLVLSVLLNLTNVTLDVVFVIGLGWGVEGVALATVIAEWLVVGAGTGIVLGALRDQGWRGGLPEHLWRGRDLRRLLEVSGNLVVRSFFVQLPFFVFTVVGATFGDLILAANAIIMQLLMAMAFGLDALAHTAETLTGYAVGARDATGLRRSVGYSLVWALALALLISAAYLTAGPSLIALLTVLPEVRSAAGQLLPWAVVSPLVAVWAFYFDGVFIGATRTVALRNCMLASAACYGAVLWLCLETLQNTGLWLAMMVFFAVRGLLLGALYPGLERSVGATVAT